MRPAASFTSIPRVTRCSTEPVWLQAKGRSNVSDREADQILADIFATAGDGDAAMGAKGVAVPLTATSGAHYVAHVLSLTSGARWPAGSSAVASTRRALDAPSLPEAIAKAFKLTPAELRVLLAILEVGGIPEVVEVLGIKPETVKTHLRRLFQKR
jgi:DNA-binding CsgD family transcriptional regulator